MSYQRECGWCGRVLTGRAGQLYCNRSCKRSALRARRRREERSNYLLGTVAPSESRAADERFRAVMAESQAAEDSKAAREAQERQWAAYERRHGTQHPGRLADRLERLRAEQAARAPVLQTPSVAERGRAGRSRRAPGPVTWDDDPDLTEPAEMVDAGDWRRGRRF